MATNDNDKDDRHLALSGAYNVRDLGGYRTRAGDLTLRRRLLRADSPHRLTSGDLDLLLGTGLRTVIDLRAPHELAGAPNPLGVIASLDYLHLPLFDALAPANVHEGATGPDPLPDFYARTLSTRAEALREVMQAITEAPPGAVMFHCTAGKDRTGVIAALLLGNADVRDADIVADYARTERHIAPLVAEFLERARVNGTDVDAYGRALRSRPETMRRVLADIARTYGTVPDYLAGIGLDSEQRARLAARLLAAAPRPGRG